MSSWSRVAIGFLVVAVWACDKHARDEHFAAPAAPPPVASAPRPPPGPIDAAAEPPEAGVASPIDASVGTETDGGGAPSDQDAALASEADAGDGVTDEPRPEPFTKRKLLEAAGQCVLQHYQAFASDADGLSEAVAGYRASLSPERRQAAQSSFVDAMRRFQAVELFRIGPAARSMDPGGQDLRDWIYAFPQTNRCQIDRHLVSRAYATEFEQLLFNSRGLGALEYLLFYAGSENACAPLTDINATGSWAALGDEELEARRAAYAEALATDIRRRADALVMAWLPSGGDFMRQLVEAGEASDVFASQQAALNAVSHALFYVEKEVKDYKLGWPLGLVAECVSGHCPEAAESPYARISLDNIEHNLRAFRSLFEGCGDAHSGVGFDDWLRAAYPDGDLDRRMLEALKRAEQRVADFDGSLEDAFYDDPAAAAGVHAAVKGITDLLKTEFVSVLNLELPMTAEGDND